jgi:hypothetical protein
VRDGLVASGVDVGSDVLDQASGNREINRVDPDGDRIVIAQGRS